MPELDATDARILLALDDEPQASVMALATRLGLARNTVHARLRRLEDSGALGAHSRRLDPAALGRGLLAFITLSISQGRGDLAGSELALLPEVSEIRGVTGDGGLLARVGARDTAGLSRITELVVQAPGVVRASTSIALLEVQPMRIAPLLEQHVTS